MPRLPGALGFDVPRECPPRRFPPPWSVEETAACFIVRDKARKNSIHLPATLKSI